MNAKKFSSHSVIKKNGDKEIVNNIDIAKNLISEGKFQIAKVLLEGALSQPLVDQVKVIHLLFIVAYKERNFNHALMHINHLIDYDSENDENYNNKGVILVELGDLNQAVEAYSRAISLNPNFVDAYFNRANAYDLSGSHQLALNDYDQIINLDRADLFVWINRGVALKRLGKVTDSLISYAKALQIRFDLPEVHFNCGIAYAEQRDFPQSIKSYNLAIQFNPNYSLAYNFLGLVYSELNQYSIAKECFTKALKIDPLFADAHFNLGKAQQELKELDHAINSFSSALRINPNISFGMGCLLHAKMLACDWNGLDELHQEIIHGILEAKQVAEPFGFQAISESELNLFLCAKLFFANRYQNIIDYSCNDVSSIGGRPADAKIRVGYVGGEFREQATTILLAGIWERHNKDKFEIYAFDNGWEDSSIWRNRVESAFYEIIDIRTHSDLDVVKMIRERRIDILINLNGYFGRHRNGLFKLKPAQLQVNFLGFPGTLGDECMDYIVSDRCVLPVASQNFYCEKVVYMPDTYQPNDKSRKISDGVFTRNDLGLPDDGFVYCSFNNNYKITPRIFESWMKILNQVKSSVLWLLEDNHTASNNLRTSAKILGIDPDRLIFAKRVGLEHHLSRQRCADLFLDTLPYNAHTTASDALGVGLPLLTIRGNTFPGRVASSLLESLNLNELVVDSFEDYEIKAVKLASDKGMYSRVKSQLKSNIESSPVFNADLYTVNFENILLKIHQRHLDKLPPIHM